jgi:hypothetical protein
LPLFLLAGIIRLKNESQPLPKIAFTKGSFLWGYLYMKRTRGAFRNLARGAKERLSGNFWLEVRGAKLAEIEKALQNGRTCDDVLDRLYSGVKSKVTRVQESDPEAEQFYARVRTILCESAEQNPLPQVLDRDFMRGLGDAERERYVFNLSEKVKACIERFKQEQVFETAVCV